MLLLVLFSSLLALSHAATLNKKVSLPDNDAKLNALIYSSVLPRTNGEVRDSVWWVPVPGSKMHATKVTVSNSGRLYSTYSFTLVSGKSSCSRSTTPSASLRRCSINPKYSDRQSCDVSVAVFEDDPSHPTEMEPYCTMTIGPTTKPSDRK